MCTADTSPSTRRRGGHVGPARHERSKTTLDLYTRRTDNSSRIRDALNDPADDNGDEDDPDDGPAPVSAPA